MGERLTSRCPRKNGGIPSSLWCGRPFGWLDSSRRCSPASGGRWGRGCGNGRGRRSMRYSRRPCPWRGSDSTSRLATPEQRRGRDGRRTRTQRDSAANFRPFFFAFDFLFVVCITRRAVAHPTTIARGARLVINVHAAPPREPLADPRLRRPSARAEERERRRLPPAPRARRRCRARASEQGRSRHALADGHSGRVGEGAGRAGPARGAGRRHAPRARHRHLRARPQAGPSRYGADPARPLGGARGAADRSGAARERGASRRAHPARPALRYRTRRPACRPPALAGTLSTPVPHTLPLLSHAALPPPLLPLPPLFASRLQPPPSLSPTPTLAPSLPLCPLSLSLPLSPHPPLPNRSSPPSSSSPSPWSGSSQPGSRSDTLHSRQPRRRRPPRRRLPRRHRRRRPRPQHRHQRRRPPPRKRNHRPCTAARLPQLQPPPPPPLPQLLRSRFRRGGSRGWTRRRGAPSTSTTSTR